MEYITLGKTGLKVSRLGFGGIPIQKVDAETTRTLIKAMAEKGINYIDTARGYTVSEEFLGFALEGLRDKFILATKSMARTKEAMAKDIDVTLKNLRTDYIDYYLMHMLCDVDTWQRMKDMGIEDWLEEKKKSGKPLPKLYMWCGTEDFIYELSVSAHKKLTELEYDLVYEESSGDHQWKYWDEKIQTVLNWLPIKNSKK